MKPSIIETRFGNGGVRFVLCHNKKSVWISEAIPVFGGKFDGGWIAREHAPESSCMDGYFYPEREDAATTARQMIELRSKAILN
ncbi:MAG: hypothetical protein ABSA74_00870 [Candidatus Staskawiczbacteria bacterium]|jgi:hypothetical protein